VIHDRDSIFSRQLDTLVKKMGVAIPRTPVRAPKANSICERIGGTLLRECLDFVIPAERKPSEVDGKELANAVQPW
jgi:hypothetical protein